MSCFGLDAKRRQGTGTAVTAAEVPKEGKKIEGIYDVFQRDRAKIREDDTTTGFFVSFAEEIVDWFLAIPYVVPLLRLMAFKVEEPVMIRGQSAREVNVNVLYLLPLFGLWCYYHHDGIMKSSWWGWAWYKALVTSALGAYRAFHELIVDQVARRKLAVAIVLALGFVLGLAASFQRFRNRAYKLTLANALQTEPGFSYVKTVLGKLPFYISMRGEGDTCEWLNIIVSEIFPAFSGFLANLMAFAVEPVLDWAKPPGIKSMKFRRFTLGTRPARFTGARAVQFTRRAKDHVAIDLDFTFDSDAEIQFAVEVGKITSLAVVRDIKMKATIRILLKPFFDRPPMFQSLNVSFVGSPFIRMRVESKGIPLPSFVLNFISQFVTKLVLNMFVWPDRLMVPMDFSVKYYELERKPSAVVLSRVIRVKVRSPGQGEEAVIKPNLRYRLAIWSGNAFNKSYTSVETLRGDELVFGLDKGSNAAGERFEIVVKEPQIETIRVALEMIHGNTVTGFEEEEVARYEFKLRDLMNDNLEAKEDLEVRYTLPLSTEEFGSPGGRMVGDLQAGFILNQIFQGLDSDYGALYVKIICAKGVPKVDVAGWAEPYFLIRLPDESGVHKEVFRTPAKKCRDDRSSVWYGVEYTGMKIKIRDAVKGPFLPDRDVVVELWDKDRITKDTRIGTWKMPISELCKEEHGGAIAKTFRMDGECDEKLIPKHRRHWNEKKLGPPYVPEYTPTDKPGRSSCKIEFEAIFAWLGYH